MTSIFEQGMKPMSISISRGGAGKSTGGKSSFERSITNNLVHYLGRLGSAAGQSREKVLGVRNRKHEGVLQNGDHGGYPRHLVVVVGHGVRFCEDGAAGTG